MMPRVTAAAVLLFLAAGCDKKKDVAGSCLLKAKATGTTSSCAEYADAKVGKVLCDAVAAQVTALSATWSTTPCPTEGALARCKIPRDPIAKLPASTDYYYAPAFAADLGKAACDENRGKFAKADGDKTLF